MHLRYFVALFLGLVASFSAKDWSVGSLRFQLEDGWQRTSDVEFTRLIAPRPIVAAVTIDALDREARISSPTEYAKSALPQLAKRHGMIVAPLTSESLSSGALLFSISFYEKKRDKFGMVFVHISARGRMAQFAVEGKGHPDTFFAKYRASAITTRWSTGPNQALEPTTPTVMIPAAQEITPAGVVAHL